MGVTSQKAKNQNIAREENMKKELDKAKLKPRVPFYWSDKKKRDAVNAGTHRY
jgi:hypothetical protein